MLGASGTDYREGMSLRELFEQSPDDLATKRYFTQARWP